MTAIFLHALDWERIQKIDRFMDQYLASDNVNELYRQNRDLLFQVKPLDIFFLHMYQNDTVIPIDKLKNDAGKFVNLFHHGLAQFQWNDPIPMALQLLRDENEAIKNHLTKLKPLFLPNRIMESLPTIIAGIEAMQAVEKKLLKLQNLLFPIMESHLPTVKPFQVLWAVHDDIIQSRQTLLTLLRSASPNMADLHRAIGLYYYQLFGLIEKEDLILFPVASQVVTDSEWRLMVSEANQIGYAFLELPEIEALPNQEKKSAFSLHEYITPTGTLSIEELDRIFSHLPYAITYVDENDQVRYYNDTPVRHFQRSPQIIGRKVELCHPEKSVHIVQEIIDTFRRGSEHQADFWFQHKDKWLYVQYIALRDPQKNYRGVLEISEDISFYRSIQSEKRLLSWGRQATRSE